MKQLSPKKFEVPRPSFEKRYNASLHTGTTTSDPSEQFRDRVTVNPTVPMHEHINKAIQMAKKYGSRIPLGDQLGSVSRLRGS